jgi:hypothetical protein
MKRGQVWISAVLYMALGVIILTIVLAAGMPVINKMKDKNAILQTKDVMNVVNKNIRSAYTQGPGSQRAVKIEIKRGSFRVGDMPEEIIWEMETKVAQSEPGVEIKEGDLTIMTMESGVEDRYITKLNLSYLNVLNLTTNIISLEGSNNLLILNRGTDSYGKINIHLEAI